MQSLIESIARPAAEFNPINEAPALQNAAPEIKWLKEAVKQLNKNQVQGNNLLKGIEKQLKAIAATLKRIR